MLLNFEADVLTVLEKKEKNISIISSVADPFNFDMDPDPFCEITVPDPNPT